MNAIRAFALRFRPDPPSAPAPVPAEDKAVIAAALLAFAMRPFAPATDPEAVERDAYEERAAILEHDAELPRAEAERRAAGLRLASGQPCGA